MPDQEPIDHGKVVKPSRVRISWAWVIPIIAAAATVWLFWSHWRSNGPEIEISFKAAPGLQVGKTLLIYRGVAAGTVTGVQFDDGLDTVVVRVRLLASAAGIARRGTDFWIDQPVISLEQTTGLDSIIQGNSIQARMGSGPPASKFVGLEKPPLTPLEDPSLEITLHASKIPYLERGTPVYYHGVAVGVVQEKALDEKGHPYLGVVLDAKFNNIVRDNSRFWHVPAAQIKAGPGMFKVDVAGVKALLQGAIEFESFEGTGTPVKTGANFELFINELAARSSSAPIRISFSDGHGLLAGQTPVCYRGQPIGQVEAVAPNPAAGSVEAIVRLEPEYASFRAAGTRFTLVRPRVSVDGVSGLETAITGVYLACEPGPGVETERFAGRTVTEEDWTKFQAEQEGLRIVLRASDIPFLDKGTPLLYHGLVVGEVKGKTLGPDNLPRLQAIVRKEFAPAVRSNSRFWRLPATALQAGPGTIQFELAGLQTLWQGGIAFDTFSPPAEPAAQDVSFELFNNAAIARADSPPIRITFDNGQGLLAGQTQVRYLGLPVGVVDRVIPLKNKIQVVARIDSGYDFLRRQGSLFKVVRPKISLKEVSGLETLLSGVYIECVPPAEGRLVQEFVGQGDDSSPLQDAKGLLVVLRAPASRINTGAPVYYRGLAVGKVISKGLSPDGNNVDFVVAIDTDYAPLVRTNTQFWDLNGTKISIGFISINIQNDALQSLTPGALAFATPDNPDMGPRAKRGQVFPLNKGPRREWQKWNPTIPLENP